MENQDQADSYDTWFREQVRASIAGKRPGIPHDEAMARIRKAIPEAAKKSA